MTQINRLSQRISNLSPEIWSKIAKIDELNGQWIGGAKLDSQALGRLKKSVLITSSGSSTRIEGAKMSDGDIEKLMRGLVMQKFSDRDKQEVRGYYELLENIFDSWKHITFSESAVKHFHNELLKYAVKDERHRGDYKKTENKVVALDEKGSVIGTIFETTPAYLTPKEMQELVEWLNKSFEEKKNHSLVVIANFLIEFLKIHPFQDGNGRLSRIITNLLLLKAGYLYMPYVSHEKFIEDNKLNYYMALRNSQKTFNSEKENIELWLTFFLDMILKQSEMAVDLLSRENIEKILSPKQLVVWKCFESGNEVTPGEIMKHAMVARPTVNQALDKLLRLKRIERIGLGRSTRYKIKNDIK